jgi:hypothetical protein
MATRGSTSWRLGAWGTPCEPDIVAMAIYAGGPRFQCDRRTREAFTRLGAGRPEVPNSNYDAMHFEIIATPAELARGFSLEVPTNPISVLAYPVIRRGAKGPLVVELQQLLGLGNTTGVGDFGPRTEQAVLLYQRSRGLLVDGIVGHGTWTALLTHQPPIAVSGVLPRKAA